MGNKEQVFWDSYSNKFNSIYGTKNTLFNKIINRYFRQSMKLRFDKTINNIPATAKSVLDVGCGPGHFCVELAKKGIPIIRGLDFSSEMIELAIANSKNEGVSNFINFSVCNFLKFKEENKYEYIIMMGFIEYFENPILILEKAIKIASNKIFISFPKNGGILALQRKIRYKNRCYLKLYSEDEIKKLLSELGIFSYEIESIARDFYVTLHIGDVGKNENNI